MRKLFRHVRLLPAVMVLAAALLVIKGEGLVEARAQDSKTAPSAIAHSANSDPASDSAEQGSASTVDVLTSLSHRRAELDAREQGLTTRENLIAAAAKRVDQRIAELKALQAKLQSLLGMRDAAEQKQFDQLVKSYSSMRPKDAARIFNALDDAVLVPVAAAMKADVLGAILAQMQPETAQKLTVKLANRLNPQKIETQAAQLAAATPPPQTAQPVAIPAAAAQSDPAQPSPEPAQPTAPPQKSADNSPATSAPAQSAPTPADSAKPVAKHRHRARKLALAQAAYTKPAPVQSTAPQTPTAQPSAKIAPQPQQTQPSQQAIANTTQRPQAIAPTTSTPAGTTAKPAPQPPAQRTVQTTTPAPVAQAMSPGLPSAPAGK